jgi:hypothetical protein
MGIHRDLVAGKSARAGRHVRDAGLVGGKAGGVGGDRGGVQIPRSAADRAGGRNVGDGAVGGAVRVGAYRGRTAGAVLCRRSLQLRGLRERNRKARGLRLKRNRDRLALVVAVAGPVAVIGIFVSTALERKTHGNGKESKTTKVKNRCMKPPRRVSPLPAVDELPIAQTRPACQLCSSRILQLCWSVAASRPIAGV